MPTTLTRLVAGVAAGAATLSLASALAAAPATAGTLATARGLVATFAPQDPPAQLLPLTLYDALRNALAPETAETEIYIYFSSRYYSYFKT